MKRTRLSALLIFICIGIPMLSGQTWEKLEDLKGIKDVTASSGIASPVTIEIIYDNYVKLEGTRADWGFSVLIEGLDKEVLFDTGLNPGIFESNLRKEGIDPSKIDMLVMSHEHGDHAGGIASLVKMKTGIPALIPHSFSEGFKKHLESLGLKPVLVYAPSEICSGLYTSGEFNFVVAEESLVIDTKNGLVVITGCAHPGIVDMLTRIEKDFGKNVYMVMGGFHLLEKSDAQTSAIIADMKKLGVVKCGPTHCTGEKQMKMFREAFGDNYIELGTGNKIVIQ